MSSALLEPDDPGSLAEGATTTAKPPCEVNNNNNNNNGLVLSSSDDPVQDEESRPTPPPPALQAAQDDWMCVSRLPRDMPEEELRQVLGRFGQVSHLRMVHSKVSGEWRAFFVRVCGAFRYLCPPLRNHQQAERPETKAAAVSDVSVP